MDARELSVLLNGRLIGTNANFSGFHFDSREISENSVFVPIKGKRDGHLFIEDAFKRDAAGTLTSQEIEVPEGKFAILVEDTLESFKRIARWKRKNFKGKTIAITGSVGKTTTKELVSYLLNSCGYRVHKNQKSFNNELGVTYTLSNLENTADFYVQEIGTSHPGEIPLLTSFVKPEVSIVTSVEPAHMENFKSFEELLSEKMSITENAHVGIVPHKYRNLSKARKNISFGREGDVKLTDLRESANGTEFEISAFGEKVRLFTEIPGFSVVNSSLICAALFLTLGIPLRVLKEIISFSPPSMRMEILKFDNGVLINDSYNANPASFRNALKVLSLFPFAKVVVAGDMLELGEISEEEHRKLGQLMNHLGISELIAYGEKVKETVKAFKGKSKHFTNRKELISFIEKYPVENKAILIKGSRGNKLEEIAQIIRKRFSE
jgi:UDP-N-acetylmuramoyl-tripeptide--D-alanyl-D-alanine ligase